MTDIDNDTKTYGNTTLYKIWRRGRFCSLSAWKNKVMVDIGTFDEKSGKLKENTACFLDTHEFLAYLYAEMNGIMPVAFSDFESKGYISFGGKDNLSRVFKSHYWGDEGKFDKNSRVFKCGHFEGKVSSTGAIEPNYQKSISQSSIKVTFEDLIMMYLAINKAFNELPHE